MAFLSCSNDEKINEVNNFTVEPSPYEISEIRILTKQGEVSNDTLITFLQQNQSLQHPNNHPLYKDLTGTFYSNQTVKTTFFDRTQNREVNDYGGYQIWENIEYVNSVFYPYEMFKYQRPNYTKILDEDYPNDDRFSRQEYRDCLFIEKDETGSYLPMTIAIYITNPSLSTRRTIQYYENNVFESNFPSAMSENDTIVIQSYKLKIIND
tara:strand:- start:95 stop:721 length:627 start_codon:yes stop_codon:yes gene_type:complete